MTPRRGTPDPQRTKLRLRGGFVGSEVAFACSQARFLLGAGSLEQPRLSRRIVVCLGAPFINFSFGGPRPRLKGHWWKPHVVAVLTFARTPAFAGLHSVCDGQGHQESSRVSEDDGWPFTLLRLVD